MAKEIFAYLENGVSVMIPDNIDPQSEQAADIIRGAFRDMVLSQDVLEYNIEDENVEESDQLRDDILNVLDVEDAEFELDEDEIEAVKAKMDNYDYSSYNEHIWELIQEVVNEREEDLVLVPGKTYRFKPVVGTKKALHGKLAVAVDGDSKVRLLEDAGKLKVGTIVSVFTSNSLDLEEVE